MSRSNLLVETAFPSSVQLLCIISLKSLCFQVYQEMMRASGWSARLKIKVDMSLTLCPIFKGRGTLDTCLKFCRLLPDIYGSDMCVTKGGFFYLFSVQLFNLRFFVFVYQKLNHNHEGKDQPWGEQSSEESSTEEDEVGSTFDTLS